MQLAFRWPERWYPHAGVFGMPQATRDNLFAWARQTGFAGTEVSVAHLHLHDLADGDLAGIRDQLRRHDLAVAALSIGGFSFGDPATRPAAIDRFRRAIEIAGLMGTQIVNATFAGPRSRGVIEMLPENWSEGGRISVGGSPLASEDDIRRTASGLAEAADAARPSGITISIEIHQNTYADTAESALRLLRRVDRPNVGLNADVGNILWAYDRPSESVAASMIRLAPHTVYQHMKNVHRVHIPELGRSLFIRPTYLAVGSIDWRFCLTALMDAGYAGWLTFEGDFLAGWDFRRAMEENAAYVRSVLADAARELDQFGPYTPAATP